MHYCRCKSYFLLLDDKQKEIVTVHEKAFQLQIETQ